MFEAVTHRFAVGDRVRYLANNEIGTIAYVSGLLCDYKVNFDNRALGYGYIDACNLSLILRAVPTREIHISQDALALASLGDDGPAPPNPSAESAFWLLYINGVLRELEG